MTFNAACQDDHKCWKTYGLGLQDMHGALARERINLHVPWEQVEQDVSTKIHARLDEVATSPEAAPTIASFTCWQHYGYCSHSVRHELASSFAHRLKQETLARKLTAGSLLTLQPKSLDNAAGVQQIWEPHSYFLGVLCQKPLQQVLLTAVPKGNSKYSVVESMDAVPECATSHHVFHGLLEACPPDTQVEISVQVLSHTFERSLWSVEQLEVTVQGVFEHFVLKLPVSNSATVRPRVELPFGLKPVKRPRKQCTAARGRGKGRQKGGAKGSGRSGRANREESQHSDSGQSSRSSSSTSSISVPSVPSSTEHGQDSGIESDGAVEHLAMPNMEAAQEAKSLAEAASEFQAFVRQRAEVAAACRAGTFFKRHVGFDEGSIAPTARSQCYHCNAKIARGSPRFSYFWDERRPSRYLHDTCVVDFVRAKLDTRMAQAVEAMQQIVQSTDVAEVRHAAERVLSLLSGSAASSSAAPAA